MSDFSLAGPIRSHTPTRLTGNTATTVFTGGSGTAIASIICTPTSGTPTCTIEICNASGTGVMKLRAAQATTAGTPLIFNEAFTLPPDYIIKVTSSAASGDMDVMVTTAVAVAAASPRAK